MAKSENNEVMFGARGRVGNLVVFKNFGNNQTVIAKRPRRSENPVYTAKQIGVKQVCIMLPGLSKLALRKSICRIDRNESCLSAASSLISNPKI